MPTAPHGRGHLRSRGVRRADEQDVASDELGDGIGDLGHGVRNQAHVSPPTITRSHDALDHASVRKDVEVMSEQVRGDRKRPRKFGGRPVRYT